MYRTQYAAQQTVVFNECHQFANSLMVLLKKHDEGECRRNSGIC
jgi:hypothetical protein